MASVTLISTVLAATILYLHSHVSPACARLTEFKTERLPILAHNLHATNIDLKTLSQRAKLGPRGGFRFKNGDFHKTRKGGKRVRLVQTYAGYEVYGPTVAAELDLRGYFTGQMYGEVARDLHKDIPNPEACVRDVKTLLDGVIRLENLHCADKKNIDERDGRRVILADPEKHKAVIAYVVEFFYSGNDYVSSPVYYIDACQNNVIFHFDQIRNATVPRHNPNRITRNLTQQISINSSNVLKFKPERGDVKAIPGCSPSVPGVGGNPNTGRITYNVPPYCLPVTESDGTCTMETTHVKVVDYKGRRFNIRKRAISFPCDEGFSDPTNGAYGVANDALLFGHLSGSFFMERYGVKALKKKPRIAVHYRRNFGNAFWSGSNIYIGDGNNGMFYPFTGLKLIAHELAHGFTISNSHLIYRFQMGGIDEAFSDITAVATKHYFSGTIDWTLGDDVTKSGDPIRYLNNPPKDGKSIDNIEKYHPFLNVHYSSGVFNFAFYNLIQSEGVSIIDGYEDFMVANRDLWGRFTRFRKGACNVMQASYDNGHEYTKIHNAFSATGILLDSCDFDALKTTLFPGETRTNIVVRSAKSPILEIDMRKWKGIGARVEAEDMSVVRIVAASDRRVEKIIAEGDNYIEFPGNHAIVYVQLMSDHKEDMMVKLQVLQET